MSLTTAQLDKISAQCRKEHENGVKYRQGRVSDWQATEDQYFGRVKKSLRGRFNVPPPIMSGFIDTLLSKIDEPPALRFKPKEEADFRSSKKVQAAYEICSTEEDADWSSKDIDAKKLAAFYGRAIYTCFGESDPKFRFILDVVDPYDFYCDPLGGGNLEDHKFMGRDHIFKSRFDLLRGSNNKLYIKEAVESIINSIGEDTLQNTDTAYQNKSNRLTALGLESMLYNYVADGSYHFIESATTFEGVRYYVLWHYETGKIIRFSPLKEMFKSELWWFTSWATHRDRYNFWSKAPADDIRPIAETIRIFLNQELDNRQKKNWGQRAYDPAIFPDARELEFRPDGLVKSAYGASKVTALSNGIYQFQTPELSGTINLIEWMDKFVGQKSGVTADAQGQSDESKVGIYYGNLQQVADRLGLYNKSYSRCHAAIGRRFVWSLVEHLTTPMSVKLIGSAGIEWDELKSKEVDPYMNILVEGGNAQMQADEIKKKKRTEALLSIKQDPRLVDSVNKTWLIEQLLSNGEFTEEEIRVAVDTQNDANREVLAKAAEAIRDILEGKNPKLCRNANTAFQQKIMDYALDNTDGDLQLFQRLMNYVKAHNQIVSENTLRMAMRTRASRSMGLPKQIPPMNAPQLPGAQDVPPEEMPQAEPMPNTPAATASRSQMMPAV